MGRRGAATVLTASMLSAAPAVAEQQVVLPANDLNMLLGLTSVETPAPAPAPALPRSVWPDP